MSRRLKIGQAAPSFELPMHDPTVDDDGRRTWSLDDELGRDRAVVLVFHRHIH